MYLFQRTFYHYLQRRFHPYQIILHLLMINQRLVLQAIPARRGIGIEALGRASGLDPGRLLATLLELEIAGRIRQLPGRRFVAVGDPI